MEKITEILDKRHKERKSRLDNLQELRTKETSASEGIEYFESVFDEKVREIQNNLNNLEAGDNNLPITFSKIGQSLQDLQKFLSTSTFFLNDRKVQKCQDVLNELSALLEDKKTKLIPKKKFGFRNRVVETKKKEDVVDAPQKPALNFDFTIANRQNDLITFDPVACNEKDLTIADIANSIIKIEGHPGSLFFKNVTNCIITSGPVSRAVFGDNCQRCIFAVACQQLRVHNSSQCDIYLHVTSRGIIEDTNQIRVGPYNLKYAGIESDFLASGLMVDKNHWDDLADFNWLSTEQRSPNWSVIPEDQKISDWNQALEEFSNQHIAQS